MTQRLHTNLVLHDRIDMKNHDNIFPAKIDDKYSFPFQLKKHCVGTHYYRKIWMLCCCILTRICIRLQKKQKQKENK